MMLRPCCVYRLGLGWKEVLYIANFFPHLTELHLEENSLKIFQPAVPLGPDAVDYGNAFSGLRKLNLSKNKVLYN